MVKHHSSWANRPGAGQPDRQAPAQVHPGQRGGAGAEPEPVAAAQSVRRLPGRRSGCGPAQVSLALGLSVQEAACRR